MKMLLLTVLFYLPAFAQPALVNHFDFNTGGGGTTSAISTTGATLLIVCPKLYSATTVSVTSSPSNTWTLLGAAQTQGTDSIVCYAAFNPAVSSSQTFSASTSVYGFYVLAFSGVKLSSPLDQNNGAIGSGTTFQAGQVIPTVNDEVIVAVISTRYETSGIDSSFTLVDSDAFNGGVVFGGGSAYLVQSSAAAVNPTWSIPGAGSTVEGLIFTFFPTTGAVQVSHLLGFGQ